MKSPTLPLALYAAATGLLEPLAPALLARRAGRGKEDPARLHERLARPTVQRPEGPLVWLHGVSVGESLSLLPLIEALVARPGLNLLVTSGTVTSAALLAQRLPDGVIHQYAPVDGPAAVTRFLDHWQPSAALFVESELWPNLILAAKSRGVRLALLSARMTEASALGWSRYPASAHALLGSFDLVLPQDQATAARLLRLGAVVGPALNLKLVGKPPPVDPVMTEALKHAAEGRSIVMAASTHSGEERLIAEATRNAAADGPEAFLVIAPRHPDRGRTVAAEMAAIGFKVGRRTDQGFMSDNLNCYIFDTLGELGALYASADVVVMGGSFVEGIGGHNPLEAARLGAAIVTGPHVANARSIYDAMLTEVACVEAKDAEALTRHIRGLLDNFPIARRIGEAALAYANRQGAALDAAMALLEPLLPA